MQIDDSNPTDNLAKNATVMVEAGYCFYNLAYHPPIIHVKNLQIKGRHTESHRPMINKRSSYGLLSKRVVNLDLH